MAEALRLNLGSGQRPFAKPWVNVDAQERWQPDLVADCVDLPYDAGSCEMIVMHHVWEHLGCGESLPMQKEAFRLLQPYGSLLVFVPNMRVLAQKWLMGKLDTQVYMTAVYGAYMGDEHDRHKWGFTPESLEHELRHFPWQDVRKFNWRVVPGADIARDDWIIGMECVR